MFNELTQEEQIIICETFLELCCYQSKAVQIWDNLDISDETVEELRQKLQGIMERVNFNPHRIS